MKVNEKKSEGANENLNKSNTAEARKPKKTALKAVKKTVVDCTECLFYDFDEECEEYSCRMMLDEDEYWRLLSNDRYVCPYYRKYDEYKSVRMQN